MIVRNLHQTRRRPGFRINISGTNISSTRFGYDGLDRFLDCQPWPNDPAIALLTLTTGHENIENLKSPNRILNAANLTLLIKQLIKQSADQLIDQARADGYETIRTSALSPSIQQIFTDMGFEVVQDLAHLELNISDDMAGRLACPEVSLRRAFVSRRSDRQAIVKIDNSCFEATWSLDYRGVRNATRATGKSYLRIAQQSKNDVGFVISGRSLHRGYIQRLAVAPRAQRSGIASALLGDSISWMANHGVTTVLVNTERSNNAALALYKKFGFGELIHGLVVMQCALG